MHIDALAEHNELIVLNANDGLIPLIMGNYFLNKPD